MLLVDGESQVQKLQLAVVPVQHVPPRHAILAGAPHVLAQAVEGDALLRIPLGVIAVRVLDVVLQRADPVDLVLRLERHGYHGRLRHCGGEFGPPRRGRELWEGCPVVGSEPYSE